MDKNHLLRDVFLYMSGETTVPDWIALDGSISLEARNLAHRIIVTSKRPVQLSLQEHADALGVSLRTAHRWIRALCEAGYVQIERVGRCSLYRVYPAKQKGDTMRVTYRKTHDTHGVMHDTMRISDPHGVMSHTPPVMFFSGNTKPENAPKSENTITDRPGGGGDHDSFSKNPTTTTPTPAPEKWTRPTDEPQTETERYMREVWKFGARKAYELRHLDLDACKADYAARRAEGTKNGGIIRAWELSPPQATPTAEPSSSNHWSSDRERLRAMYGDLVKFGDELDHPRQHLDRRNPDVNEFLGECGL